MKRKWEKRIMQEKNYSENTAKWMTQHLEALHAIRTRRHRILQTKREVQIRESYAKVL